MLHRALPTSLWLRKWPTPDPFASASQGSLYRVGFQALRLALVVLSGRHEIPRHAASMKARITSRRARGLTGAGRAAQHRTAQTESSHTVGRVSNLPDGGIDSEEKDSVTHADSRHTAAFLAAGAPIARPIRIGCLSKAPPRAAASCPDGANRSGAATPPVPRPSISTSGPAHAAVSTI